MILSSSSLLPNANAVCYFTWIPWKKMYISPGLGTPFLYENNAKLALKKRETLSESDLKFKTIIS